MNNIIFSLTFTFQIFVFTLTLYYLALSFFGFYKKKVKKSYKPEKSFALIVAAHNEENVIGKIIESLKELEYPEELYDIFIIADNCTDNTAKIANTYGGVNVFERFNKTNRGKGYALDWMFDKIFKMEKKYDSIAIFDADNIVSKNFLSEMNNKLKDGYKVVQGYIDSKNPHDSWITQSYSISFWSANRVFQLARQNLGLSNQIGGTGFVVETETLKELGWGATCLTEDLEFTCKLVLNGHKVGWSHEAVVYDEKPLTLKQSWNQRKRWMQGFVDVSSRYMFKLLKKAIVKRDFVAFDCALYTMQPFVIILIGIAAMLTLAQSNVKSGLNIYVINDMFPSYLWKSFSIFQFMFTPLILLLDKKLSKKLFFFLALYSTNVILFGFMFSSNSKIVEIILAQVLFLLVSLALVRVVLGKHSMKRFVWYLLYSIYILTWIPITIQGIACYKNKEWSHTVHTRQIGINDI